MAFLPQGAQRFTKDAEKGVNMSRNIIVVVACWTILSIGQNFAQTGSEPTLSGTVQIYPQVLQMHDILYFRVELQNKNDELLMKFGVFHRYLGYFYENLYRRVGTSMWLCGETVDDFYYWTFSTRIHWWNAPMNQKIEPNESLVAVNSGVEFPEYLTKHPDISENILSGKEINERFLANYIGTGKKCTFGVVMHTIGSFVSEDPIEIKSRSETEMAAIKAWHDEFRYFLAYHSRFNEKRPTSNAPYTSWSKVPTVKDYEDFEKQLSEGTLKNYIHFCGLLASIPDETDAMTPGLVPDEHFKKLGDFLDTLHPIERRTLLWKSLCYFPGDSKNHQAMVYLVLPKLSRAEREKSISTIGSIIDNEMDRKAILEMPEPK